MIVWTETRVADLKRHWESGLSAEDSAKELGSVTRNGVIGKRRRLGLRDEMRNVHPPKSLMGMRAWGIRKGRRPVSRMAPVPSRKRYPILPEMSKTALRDMLRCAVENTL
jgi:hypothetical protein